MLRVITLDFSPLRQGGAATVCGRRSDVGEGMALAKGLVLLGVEGLSFQVDLTDCANKACVMPAEAQSFQEAVSSINLEVTASTFCAKHLLIVSFAVGCPFLHVKGSVANRCLAGSAGEAMHVPGHLQGMHDLSSNLLLAFGTAGCIAHIIAGGAKDSPLLLKEATLFQNLSTLAAHKFFRVVCVAQRYQVAAPDDLVALMADGSLAIIAAPSCAPSSCGLHYGGAVLQRRGCGWLAMPGQHCASFVWGIALSKCRVHGPGWAAGRARSGGA